MKQVPIKLGPLALLLTVISICLTVLAILTFTTARADMALAEKYADTIRLRYELEAEGQSFLAEADAAAAEGTIELIDGLEIPCVAVGDCNKPFNIAEAIAAGNLAARKI